MVRVCQRPPPFHSSMLHAVTATTTTTIAATAHHHRNRHHQRHARRSSPPTHLKSRAADCTAEEAPIRTFQAVSPWRTDSQIDHCRPYAKEGTPTLSGTGVRGRFSRRNSVDDGKCAGRPSGRDITSQYAHFWLRLQLVLTLLVSCLQLRV